MSHTCRAPAEIAASVTARRSLEVTDDGTESTTSGLKSRGRPLALPIRSWMTCVLSATEAAVADGSFRTTPSPLTKMRTFDVPRSMPILRESIYSYRR